MRGSQWRSIRNGATRFSLACRITASTSVVPSTTAPSAPNARASATKSGFRSTVPRSIKIGFICPTVPGHLNPMTALARHLQARNHEVVFLYSSSANGLPYVAGDEGDGLNASRPEMSKLEGDSAIAFYCGLAAKKTEMIFNSLPKMAETTGIEALILDPIQFFVELAAMKLQIPYITVETALYLD